MSRDRVERLCDDVEATLAKLHDQLRQLRAAALSENPVGETIGKWTGWWKHRHGSDYDITKTDAGNIKRLVTAHGAVIVQARLHRYINDTDQFLMRQKHPLSVFWPRFNTYNGSTSDAGAADEPEAPSGCQHRPPCRSDAEHTSKKLADMRA